MTDHPGDHGKRKNLDSANHQTDHLPIPKTGLQEFQEDPYNPSVQLECLHCAYFHRIMEVDGNKPDFIDDQTLSEWVGMLPAWLADNLHTLLTKRLSEVKEVIFPYSLADGRKLKSFDQKSLLKHVALAVIDSYEKSSSAEDILQNIFSSFTKSSQSVTPDRPKLDPSGLEIKAPPQ